MAALEEQKVSGDQLGAVLVARGFVPSALVAQALATQSGSVLKTEYGFATGFGTTLLKTNTLDPPPLSHAVSQPAAALEPVTSAPARQEQQPAEPESPASAVREELELASTEAARLVEANDRLVALRAELEQRLARESQRVSALERELAEREAAPPAREPDLVAWQAAHTQAEQAVAQWQAAYAGLERQLRETTEQGALLREDLEARAAVMHELRGAASVSQAIREELERKLEDEERRAIGLAAALESAVERLALLAPAAEARDELQHRLENVTARAEALEAQVASAERRLASESSASDRARAELELNLAHAVAELAELRASASRAPWSGAAAHTVFFQGADGYELIEREGPPPPEASRVVLPGGSSHVVARVGRSPFPDSVLPCAYLVSA